MFRGEQLISMKPDKGILNDNKFIKIRGLNNPEPIVPTIDLFLNDNSIL